MSPGHGYPSLFCHACGGPAFPDPVRKRNICPVCYVPEFGEVELQFTWQQMQELIIAYTLKSGSQRAAAKHLRISPQYLNDIIRGRREISDAVAALFGLERVIVYKQRLF